MMRVDCGIRAIASMKALAFGVAFISGRSDPAEVSPYRLA